MSESYPHGLFTWTDLTTPDPAAAKSFYGELFGWTTEDMPAGDHGTYTICRKDGLDVGGLSAPQPGSDVPPMWTSYITVDDVDGVTDRVASLDGTVMMGGMDVMDAGRMSVIQDPTGGVVALWEARGHKGAGRFNVPGTMCWNELATLDQARARAFYTELLGWDTEEMDMGDAGPYVIVKAGERPNGGIMQMNDEWPADVPSHWMVYFAIRDADASAASVRELGGELKVEPMDAPVGRFFVASDPQGAAFACIALNEAEAYP